MPFTQVTESDTRDSMIQSMSYGALLPLLVGTCDSNLADDWVYENKMLRQW